ncbi:MAG: glycogen/starch/alpha-glucan phosphorylase [Collinsella aerofaciens]
MLPDSMAAEGIAGYGNGMRYRYGLFKQEIVNGSRSRLATSGSPTGIPRGPSSGQGRDY